MMKQKNKIIISIIVSLLIAFSLFLFGQRTHDDKVEVRELHASVIEADIFSSQEKGMNKPAYPIRKKEVVEPVISAESASIFQIEGEEFIYKKDSSIKRPVASLTKLMTGVLIDSYGEYDDIFTVGDYAFSTEASAGNLQPGEVLTVRNLMESMLMVSSNDGAVTLSEYLVKEYASNPSYNIKDTEASAQREGLFVKLMNKEAAKLEMFDTHFADPHGLNDTDAYSTSEDITKLFNRVILDNDLFQIVATEKTSFFSVNNKLRHNVINTHELLGKGNGVVAGKTGYTQNSLECLITLWEHKTGHRSIITVLGSESRFEDTKKLISWLNKSFVWEESLNEVNNEIVKN